MGEKITVAEANSIGRVRDTTKIIKKQGRKYNEEAIWYTNVINNNS